MAIIREPDIRQYEKSKPYRIYLKNGHRLTVASKTDVMDQYRHFTAFSGHNCVEFDGGLVMADEIASIVEVKIHWTGKVEELTGLL